jgi:diguanylate cyclase (GGDEF)-like protein
LNTTTTTEQLLERGAFIALLDEKIALSQNSNERLALLVANLRKFREINIGFGHQIGDLLLQQVADRIQAVLREHDRIYRIGNDEFAVVLTQLKTPQVVELAMAKIIDVVGNNYEIGQHILAVTAVAGAAVFPDHAADRNTLLQAADTALHYARDRGLQYSVYDTSVGRQEHRMADLKGNLRKALDNSDLSLYYQPQVNLQQDTLSGCEALVRWNHAQLGWIRPDVFIPVAEQSDLIDNLTYWSINVALREWLQFCGKAPPKAIAINLSAKLLQSPEVVDLVTRAMNIWGADPGTLVLEVTESAMMSDPQVALHTLFALHEMGITLSIDDFGTGYSSLAYLKKLPVDELKIDKSFVHQMAENKQDRKIVQTIIDLAHNLDMSVVAEGIENRQILDMLVGMGCDYGQGFYIGRPMAMADLPAWEKKSSWKNPEVIPA